MDRCFNTSKKNAGSAGDKTPGREGKSGISCGDGLSKEVDMMGKRADRVDIEQNMEEYCVPAVCGE